MVVLTVKGRRGIWSLKGLRQDRKLSQEQVALAMPKSNGESPARQAVYLLERKALDTVSVTSIVRYAKALGYDDVTIVLSKSVEP